MDNRPSIIVKTVHTTIDEFAANETKTIVFNISMLSGYIPLIGFYFGNNYTNGILPVKPSGLLNNNTLDITVTSIIPSDMSVPITFMANILYVKEIIG